MQSRLAMTTKGNFTRNCRKLFSSVNASPFELAQVINYGDATYDSLHSAGGGRLNPVGFINSFVHEMQLNRHNFHEQTRQQEAYSEPYNEPMDVPVDVVEINPTDQSGILQKAYDWLKQYEDNILALGIVAVADMRATQPSTGGHKQAEFKTAFNNALVESALGQTIAGKMPPAVFAAINKYVVQNFTDRIMTKIFNHFAVEGQISPELEAKILANPNQNLMLAAIVVMVVIAVILDELANLAQLGKDTWTYAEKIQVIKDQIELIDNGVDSALLTAKKEELTFQLAQVTGEITALKKEGELVNQLEGYIDELAVQRSQAWFTYPTIEGFLAQKHPENVREVRQLIHTLGITDDQFDDAKWLIGQKQDNIKTKLEDCDKKLKQIDRSSEIFIAEGNKLIEKTQALHDKQSELEKSMAGKINKFKDQLTEHKQESTKQEVYEEERQNELRS